MNPSHFLSNAFDTNSVWNKFGQAFISFLDSKVQSRVDRLSNIHLLMDREVLINNLYQIGLKVPYVVLDRHSNESLETLIDDYSMYRKSGISLDGFLSRLLKTSVNVQKLYSKKYKYNTGTYFIDSTLKVVIKDKIDTTFNVKVEYWARKLVYGALTNGYLFDSDTFLFTSEMANKNVRITYDDFLPYLPLNAKTIDSGGHWFLTTHVNVLLNPNDLADLKQYGLNNLLTAVFYAIAPANLIIHNTMAEDETEIGISINVRLAKQVAIRRVF